MRAVPRRIALAVALVLALASPFARPQLAEPQLGEPEPEAPPQPQAPAPFYRVVIDAPKELREMLQDGLQLVRWQEDPQMNAELLQRLVDEAEKEVKDAVATRGYFNASVRHEIERGGRPWVVTLHLDPGVRTRVRAVDLQFSGPARDDPKVQDVVRNIRREWPLRRGEPFTQRDWDDAKRDAVRKL